MFSGPLPHPEVLAKFDEVIPGTASKIVDMAHQQGEHRMMLERKVILGESRRANWGLAFAACFAAASLVCGTWLIAKGHDVAGLGVVTADLATSLVAFIKGTSSRRREREQKARIQATAP
jgi:uncharacterized membrane protein